MLVLVSNRPRASCVAPVRWPAISIIVYLSESLRTIWGHLVMVKLRLNCMKCPASRNEMSMARQAAIAGGNAAAAARKLRLRRDV